MQSPGKKFIKNGFSDDPELRYTKNPKTAEEIKAAPKAKEAHDAAVQGDTVGDPFKAIRWVSLAWSTACSLVIAYIHAFGQQVSADSSNCSLNLEFSRLWRFVSESFVYAGRSMDALVQDTSGPALNIVMKLQAIVSLVFAAYFAAINHGHGFFGQAAL